MSFFELVEYDVLFHIVQKTPEGPWFCSNCSSGGDYKLGDDRPFDALSAEVSFSFDHDQTSLLRVLHFFIKNHHGVPVELQIYPFTSLLQKSLI